MTHTLPRPNADEAQSLYLTPADRDRICNEIRSTVAIVRECGPDAAAYLGTSARGLESAADHDKARWSRVEASRGAVVGARRLLGYCAAADCDGDGEALAYMYRETTVEAVREALELAKMDQKEAEKAYHS